MTRNFADKHPINNLYTPAQSASRSKTQIKIHQSEIVNQKSSLPAYFIFFRVNKNLGERLIIVISFSSIQISPKITRRLPISYVHKNS